MNKKKKKKGKNGACVHFVMVSEIQWQPFFFLPVYILQGWPDS